MIDLHKKALVAAKEERVALWKLLSILKEVQTQRVYAQRGYASMWEYTVKYLGYSESQASERLNALRLLQALPEVAEDLRKGKVKFSNLVTVQRHIQKVERSTNKGLPQAQKRKLLQATLGKSRREAERALLETTGYKPSRADLIKPLSKDQTYLAFSIDMETLALLDEVRKQTGHQPMGKTFKESLRALLTQRQKRNQVKRVIHPTKEGAGRYISKGIRNKTSKRSGNQCEYKDDETGRRCQSRANLQFDHILPLSQGGKTVEENIRHLCPAHNRLEAIRKLGHKTMKKFIPI